jgi:hypothetical protein
VHKAHYSVKDIKILAFAVERGRQKMSIEIIKVCPELEMTSDVATGAKNNEY